MIEVFREAFAVLQIGVYSGPCPGYVQVGYSLFTISLVLSLPIAVFTNLSQRRLKQYVKRPKYRLYLTHGKNAINRILFLTTLISTIGTLLIYSLYPLQCHGSFF